MRVHLGDQLVVESPATDGARRDGQIAGWSGLAVGPSRVVTGP
ncbi:hypothetical protein ACWDZX_07245 [Streptomyces collinus]